MVAAPAALVVVRESELRQARYRRAMPNGGGGADNRKLCKIMVGIYISTYMSKNRHEHNRLVGCLAAQHETNFARF